MRYEVQIDEAEELNAEARAKFGLLKGDKSDSRVRISVIRHTPGTTYCVETFDHFFQKAVVATEDALMAEVKTAAEESIRRHDERERGGGQGSLDVASLKGRTVKL